jgi:hypothetical protein
MKRLFWIVGVVAMWALLTAGTMTTKPYFAESVMKAAGGPEMVSRMWAGGPDRWRVEVVGQPTAAIVRLDRKKMYTLLPQAKSYYETTMSEEEAKTTLQGQQPPPGKVTRKALGKETVAGRPADKYEVTVTPRGGKAQVYYEWLSTELGMPIKMAAADKSWSMEYRNIKLGPQDPKLFEVPAGFKKMVMPSLPNLPGMARPR